METVNDMRDELVRWFGLDAGFVQAQSDNRKGRFDSGSLAEVG